MLMDIDKIEQNGIKHNKYNLEKCIFFANQVILKQKRKKGT